MTHPTVSPSTRPGGARPLTRCGVLLLSTILLGGCMANPGPPPIEEPQAQEAEAPAPEAEKQAREDTPDDSRPDISVGVDPLVNGVNPHLMSDDCVLVASLADAIFPSVYVDGHLNEDLVSSVKEIEPAPGAQSTVRYILRPEAQWSDGTPITGADFRYLWEGILHTPGAKDSAVYRSVSDLRVGNNGLQVDVDFSSPVGDLSRLFQNLLPAHVLGDTANFGQALRKGVPAAGGRFLVANLDQQRGLITLHRNDRYWGKNPASVERIQLVEMRDPLSGAEQLRTGQISLVDITPQETSVDTFGLIPHTQVRTYRTARQLRLVYNVRSPLTRLRVRRAALSSVLDTDVLARLAAGRSSSLAAARESEVAAASSGIDEDTRAHSLRELASESAERPFVIGADPADASSLSAARAAVDILKNAGIEAQVRSATLEELSGTLLPGGSVDAVMTWQDINGDPVSVASRYQCAGGTSPAAAEQPSETPTASPETTTPSPSSLPRFENLSGFCDEGLDARLAELLAAPGSRSEGEELATEVEETEHLSLPILRETRVMALGHGMVGPDPDLERWPTGLSSLATWQRAESSTATSTASPEELENSGED